jgi:uncharacterized membrane protein YidH (DUF202 family)
MMGSDTEPARSSRDDEEIAGLAGERTDLAWSRSGLAATAAVAAIAKRVLDLDDWTAPSLVIVLIAGGLVAWLLALAYGRIVAGTLAGSAHRDPASLRYVALGTTTLAVGALVLALAPD